MRKGLLQNGSIAETILKSHLETHPPSFGDGDSVLSMLYESFVEANPMDDGRLKQDFNDLYELMNGMPLREMDKIVYPVCTLCRDQGHHTFANHLMEVIP